MPSKEPDKDRGRGQGVRLAAESRAGNKELSRKVAAERGHQAWQALGHECPRDLPLQGTKLLGFSKVQRQSRPTLLKNWIIVFGSIFFPGGCY